MWCFWVMAPFRKIQKFPPALHIVRLTKFTHYFAIPVDFHFRYFYFIPCLGSHITSFQTGSFSVLSVVSSRLSVVRISAVFSLDVFDSPSYRALLVVYLSLDIHF